MTTYERDYKAYFNETGFRCYQLPGRLWWFYISRACLIQPLERCKSGRSTGNLAAVLICGPHVERRIHRSSGVVKKTGIIRGWRRCSQKCSAGGRCRMIFLLILYCCRRASVTFILLWISRTGRARFILGRVCANAKTYVPGGRLRSCLVCRFQHG